MPGLHLFRSNRIELLARLLSGVVIDKAPRDPFKTIEVVVGSRGMERWLRHELAQHLSVCANFEFPFPAARLDAIVADVLGEAKIKDPPLDPWSPESLAWALLEVLPRLVPTKGFEVVQSYLDDPRTWQGAVEGKQYGLARQLADVFDRYVAYRPELARAWSADTPLKLPRGSEALAWQRSLWHAVQSHLQGKRHRADRIAEAERILRETTSHPALDAPLFMFGVSSLPPSWMSLLGALSAHVDVDLFLLCPSDTYWAELHRVAGTAAPHLASDRDELTDSLRDQGAEAAHPLLVSMGRVARDFQLILESQPDHYVDERIEAFPDPASRGTPRALQWLQSDLLAAHHPAQAPSRDARKLEDRDDSIQFHSCYGPTRQVEVLRDLLLGMLSDHPDLEPRNILVMTPNIEAYAPLITAVFSEGAEHRREQDGKAIQGPEGWGLIGAPRLGFEVADLSVRRLNPVADTLLRVLELVDSRLEASALIDLLTLEPVRTRFGLGPDDIPTLQRWIEQSGIRWARDADHRAQAGQPADPQNTWRFGLRRLMLGVVMADDGRMISGEDAPGRTTEVRPFDDMEGSETLLAGKLVDFCNTLFVLIDELRAERTLQQWVQALGRVLEQMTATSPTASWLTLRVRETLAELAMAAGEGLPLAPADVISRMVTLDAIRSALAGRFEVAGRVTREQSGAVTFCAMRPMRSVPYDVICLLGMDEDAFPRKGGGFAFDLTSLHPRVGDMDPRDEDRYLMLEAILAARRSLVVLFSGRDPRTNKEKPPCVPVGELRDLVDVSFPSPAMGLPPSRWMTTEHPLQAFSPRAFQPLHRSATAGRKPWSFDRRLMAAAEARRHKLPAYPPFLQATDAAADASKTITLDELIGFFKNPAKYLVQRRLKIDLEDRAESIPDREPIELDNLQRWQLRSSLLSERAQGRGASEVLRGMRAKGTLPLGYAGRIKVETEAAMIDSMLSKAGLASRADGKVLQPDEPVTIDLGMPGARLIGSVSPIYRSVLIDMQFGAEEGKRVVGAWLSLLSWHACHPDTAGKAVVVLGTNPPVLLGFEPPDDASALLQELVGIYQRGIREPIALFPKASWTFASGMKELSLDAAFFDQGLPTGQEALEVIRSAHDAALKAWVGGFNPGESRDPYVARLFETACPLEDPSIAPIPLNLEFARLALKLWGPVRRARRTGKDAGSWLVGDAQ